MLRPLGLLASWAVFVFGACAVRSPLPPWRTGADDFSIRAQLIPQMGPILPPAPSLEQHFSMTEFGQPLGVSEPDRDELLSALSSPGTFGPWSGEKHCAGIHADYLITWESLGTRHKLFLCLDCRETLFLDNPHRMHDLSAEGYARLSAQLGTGPALARFPGRAR